MQAIANLDRNNVRFYRQGSVVIMRASFAPAENLATGAQVGTIPEGFRPAADIAIYTERGYLYCYTTGLIITGSSMPAGWVYGSGSWMTN